MAILTKGAKAAAEIAEQEKKERPGFYRVGSLVIKDGDSIFVRFVTPRTDLVTLKVHRFMPTKPKPDECDWEKWPPAMWGVCQNDNAFRIRDGAGNLTPDFEEGYGSCYLCTAFAGQLDKFKNDMSRPTSLTYGLAVEVTPRVEGGVAVGFDEKTAEFKAEDKTVTLVPQFMIAAQRWSNFWHPVEATAFMPPNLITDKFFGISRKDKDYTITPVANDSNHEATAARYAEALTLIEFSLDDYLLGTADPDYYAKWFIPGQTPKDGYKRKSADEDGEEGSEAAATPAATAGPQIDQSAMETFRNRLSGRGAQAAAGAAS